MKPVKIGLTCPREDHQEEGEFIPYNAPKGAIGAFSGLYYKIGAHRKVYYRSGGEWIVSTFTADEIKRLIFNKKDRFSLLPCENVIV